MCVHRVITIYILQKEMWLFAVVVRQVCAGARVNGVHVHCAMQRCANVPRCIDNGQLPAIFDIIYRWYVIVIGCAARRVWERAFGSSWCHCYRIYWRNGSIELGYNKLCVVQFSFNLICRCKLLAAHRLECAGSPIRSKRYKYKWIIVIQGILSMASAYSSLQITCAQWLNALSTNSNSNSLVITCYCVSGWKGWILDWRVYWRSTLPKSSLLWQWQKWCWCRAHHLLCPNVLIWFFCPCYLECFAQATISFITWTTKDATLGNSTRWRL